MKWRDVHRDLSRRSHRFVRDRENPGHIRALCDRNYSSAYIDVLDLCTRTPCGRCILIQNNRRGRPLDVDLYFGRSAV